VSDPTPDPVAVALEYFRRMQTGEPVAELFTDDGELVGLGARVVGRDAIRAFYATARADAAPRPEPLAVASDGDRVLAEAYIHLADGTRMHVVDGFEIRGDAIRSLTYFVADYPALD
jgi:SnoaL-like domain